MTIKERGSKLIKLMGISRLLLVLAAGIVLVTVSAYDFAGEKGDENQEGADRQTNGDMADNENGDLPGGNESGETGMNQYADNLEKELNELLVQVTGVGRVMTAVSLEAGTEKVALKDSPYSMETSEGKESRSVDESTVCTEDGNQKSPYIVKEIEPVVKGVVVAAEGGAEAAVQKEIIEAVSVLFGIESHKIKVMKLK